MKLRLLTTACLAALCLCLPAAAAGEDPAGTAPPAEVETLTAHCQAELFQAGSLTGDYTRPGPALLDDGVEGELYSRIVTALRETSLSQGEVRISVSDLGLSYSSQADKDDVMSAFERAGNDHPEYFYLDNSVWFYHSGGRISSVVMRFDTETYSQSDVDIFNERVAELVAQADGMDALEKALFFHDWLVENVAYNWEVANGQEADTDVHSAYSALVRGDAVCEGYALAYNMLLRECGIGCTIVVSEPMNHAWSLVELDGSWYHADPTWDDPTPDLPGYCGHENFLRSDEGIRDTSHYGWDDPGVEVSAEEPEGIFRHTNNRIYQYGGRWYYLEISRKVGTLYRTDSLTDTEAVAVVEGLRFFAHRFPSGSGYAYYPTFSVVWDDGVLYYVAEDQSLAWINLNDGSVSALGEVPFTASASAQKEYEADLDAIGLYRDSRNGEIVAVSRTRPETVLARFQPAVLPEYPPAWDEMPGNATALAGAAWNEGDLQIGLVWAEGADAPAPWLAAAFYDAEGRLTALRVVSTEGLEAGLNVLELAGDRLPGDHARAALFLLAGDGTLTPLEEKLPLSGG